MGAYSNLTWQLLVQFLLVLFLVVAVSGLAVGVGLITSSLRIVGYFHMLNRWVSTRHVLRPVEVPVDTERVTHRHHRWLEGSTRPPSARRLPRSVSRPSLPSLWKAPSGF